MDKTDGTAQLEFWRDSILRSYSLIFFSRSSGLGLIILLATLTVPAHGLIGLLGALSANVFAYLLGFNREEINRGYWGFNAVLLSLGLGLYYDTSPQLLLLIMVSVLFMTVLTMWLKNFLAAYGLPYMSVPFNLVIYAAILTSFGTGNLTPSLEKWNLLDVSFHQMPAWLNLFCKNLGAIFFNINPIAGAVIVAGMLIYSRLSLLLLVIGWWIGYHIHTFFGVNPQLIEQQYLGFNYMLTALALGGTFVIPSFSTLALAVLGSLMVFVNLVAWEVMLPAYFSSLALSFNISVLLVVYALKMRLYPSLGITLTVETATPEENLSRFRENLKLWRRYGISISLPFFGKWQVTQAFHGAHTHRAEWAYGYDFMMKNEQGKIFSGKGADLHDYFCYDVPVLAPAAGKIAQIKNDSEDNPPGHSNPRDNWGNCVVIEHAPQFYSCVAHLKKGSIPVQVGDAVEKGAEIGRCGNSGRSPYPHIHLQFQNYAYVGAPSIYFEFSNIIFERAGSPAFLPRGILRQDDMAMNLAYDPHYQQFFPSQIETRWEYRHRHAGGEQQENWEVKIDFYNQAYLEDEQASRLYFDLYEGVLSVKKYDGRRGSALHRLAQTLVDVVFPQSEATLRWTVQTTLDYLLSPTAVHWLDFFAILGIRFFYEIDNLLEKAAADTVMLQQNSRVIVKLGRWSYTLHKFSHPRQLLFRKGEGLNYLRDGDAEIVLQGVTVND